MMGFGFPFCSDKEIYVSPPPNGVALEDAPVGSGTFTDPYHSIATGIRSAEGGGNVYLRAGPYLESVSVSGIRGKWYNRIIVQPYGNEEVTIDSLFPEFLNPTDEAHWELAPGGVEDEYIWTKPFLSPDEVTGGAFMDRPVHTRLVNYDRLDDLQSKNELWPANLPSGNRVWERKLDAAGVLGYEISEPKKYRPWVYMGPGIWFDTEDTRILHTRLSHTNNNVAGWPDYREGTDPSKVRLAISELDTHAIFLTNCEYMLFKNLTVRFGGEDTVRLRNCTNIKFDHVKIQAASRAIRLLVDDDIETERNTAITFEHCEIDGGLPTWLFRSDRKDTYFLGPDDPTAPDEAIHLNRLGASTSGVLISSNARSSHVTVHHCEIMNGHDIYLFGDQMSFHHNLVRNLNDDGLAVSGVGSNAQVYQNVVSQCMTALSFGADTPLGKVSIYRNLIDLRVPIAGRRPATAHDPASLRQGHFFKGDQVEVGPIALFQNTCIVLDPGADDSDDTDPTRGFEHYSGHLEKGGQRRAYNNIFIAMYTAKTRHIAFLPPDTFDGPTDGNTYFRIPASEDDDPSAVPMFIVDVPLPNRHFDEFADLGTYRAKYWTDENLAYERTGRIEDPQLLSFDPAQPHPDDDLRLHPISPVGATLPIDLLLMDLKVRGIRHLGTRDRGCYVFTNDRLRVGVDGRQAFPSF